MPSQPIEIEDPLFLLGEKGRIETEKGEGTSEEQTQRDQIGPLSFVTVSGEPPVQAEGGHG